MVHTTRVRAPLARRFLFAVVATLAIVAGTLGFLYNQFLHSQDERAHEALAKRTIQGAVNSARVWLDSNIHLAKGVASHPDIVALVQDPSNPVLQARAEALVRSIQNGNPFMMNLAVAAVPGTPSFSVSKPDGTKAAIEPGMIYVDPLGGTSLAIPLADRDYYANVASGAVDTWIGSPYMSRATNEPIFVMGQAIKVDGQLRGVLFMGMRLVYFTETFVDPMSVGKGYLLLTHESGSILAHPTKEYIINPDLPPEIVNIVARVRTGVDVFTDTYGVVREYVNRRFERSDMEPWYFTLSRPRDEIYANAGIDMITLGTAFAILTLALVVVIVLMFHNLVTKPLAELGARLSEVAAGGGDLTKRLTAKRRDEIGLVANNFNDFVESLSSIVAEVQKGAQVLAQKSSQLGVVAQDSSAGILEIRSTAESLSSNSRNQKNMTMDATQNLQELFRNMERIASMAESMRQTIAQSAAAIEEMAANIESSADMASRADKTSRTLEEASASGGQAVTTLIENIKLGAETSERIQEMVSLIMTISDQTNLLAMNAAIEAAHAGDAGKGFAVVSDEIRKLADQSAESGREIQSAVQAIVDGTEGNIEHSSLAAEGFEKLRTEVARVRSVNQEISTAMQEQREANMSVLGNVSGLRQLAETVAQEVEAQAARGKAMEQRLTELGNMSMGVSEALDEETQALNSTAEAAEGVRSIATELDGLAQRLTRLLEGFKTSSS